MAKLTIEKEIKLIELFEQGASIKSVSEQLNIDIPKVCKMKKNLNL